MVLIYPSSHNNGSGKKTLKWKETNLGGINFPFPWLWEEEYLFSTHFKALTHKDSATFCNQPTKIPTFTRHTATLFSNLCVGWSSGKLCNSTWCFQELAAVFNLKGGTFWSSTKSHCEKSGLMMDPAYNLLETLKSTTFFGHSEHVSEEATSQKSKRCVFQKTYLATNDRKCRQHFPWNKPQMEPHTRGSTKLWFCTYKIWKHVRLFWLVINCNKQLFLWLVLVRLQGRQIENHEHMISGREGNIHQSNQKFNAIQFAMLQTYQAFDHISSICEHTWIRLALDYMCTHTVARVFPPDLMSDRNSKQPQLFKEFPAFSSRDLHWLPTQSSPFQP